MDYTLYILIGVLLFMAVCLAIANMAPKIFMQRYEKYSSMMLNTSYTAGDFAVRLVQDSGYQNLKIAYTDKELEDAFYSKKNIIVLSTKTLESCSVAGFATVAHEFGHAVQHNSGSIRYKFLKTLKIISSLFGNFSFPLIVAGLIIKLLAINADLGQMLLIMGLVIFFISLLAELITIPIEYEASNIGLEKIKYYNILQGKEYKMAKKFLKSAGLTYVGAFLSRIFAWTFLVPKYK
ncbi:MAG: zinc metallopeptidase [Christensenellales bacterium]